MGISITIFIYFCTIIYRMTKALLAFAIVLASLSMLLYGCTAEKTAQPSAPPAQCKPSNESAKPSASGNVSAGTAGSGANLSKNISDNTTSAIGPASLNWTAGENATNGTANGDQLQNDETNVVGLPFGAGAYLLVLDDVYVSGTASSPCGIFSIRYADNASIIKNSDFIGCPPDSHYWRSPSNASYRIRVEKVAAGYQGQAMWAQVSIFG